MHFTKPKAILFDWDNTLVISRSIMYQALNAAIKQMDLDPNLLSSQQFHDSRHFSIRDAFPRIFGDTWEEAFKIYDEHFRAIHLGQILLMPEVMEFLKLMQKDGIPMSIVSNKDGPYLRQEAEKFGITKYFYRIIGSYDTNADKPSAEPVKTAIVGMDIDKCDHNIWFIGDSIVDLQCAQNSGCLPILFGENSDDIEEANKRGLKHLQAVDFDQLKSIYLSIRAR